MDTLTLKRTDRVTKSPFQSGGSFLDFIVSGVPLYAALIAPPYGYDYVSCLGWLERPFEDETKARLLGNAAPDMPRERVSLYICPECADQYCGGITASVRDLGETIIWSELAYDSGYEGEPGLDIFRPIKGLGPYEFNKADYEKTLLSADLWSRI